MDDNATPGKTIAAPEAWLVVSLQRKEKKEWPEISALVQSKYSFKYYTGELSWRSFEESYMGSEYNYELRKSVQVPRKRKCIRIYREVPVIKENKLKKFFTSLLPSKAEEWSPMLFDHLQWKAAWLDNEGNDMARILSLSPANPSTIIAGATEHCLADPVPVSESHKRCSSQYLKPCTVHGMIPVKRNTCSWAPVCCQPIKRSPILQGNYGSKLFLIVSSTMNGSAK